MKNETIHHTAKINFWPRFFGTVGTCVLVVITVWSLLAPILDPVFKDVRLLMSITWEDVDNYFSEDIMHQVYLLIPFLILGLYIAYKRFVSKYKEAE